MPQDGKTQNGQNHPVDSTGTTHLSGASIGEPGMVATSGVGDPSTITAEQDAKRVEKIRSHASSHHTAGTVTLDT